MSNSEMCCSLNVCVLSGFIGGLCSGRVVSKPLGPDSALLEGGMPPKPPFVSEPLGSDSALLGRPFYGTTASRPARATPNFEKRVLQDF